MNATANLTCKDCGAALHKTIYGETEDDIFNAKIICTCGAENGTHRCVPTNLWKTVVSLSLKGYKIANVFPNNLTIQFNGEFFRNLKNLEDLKLPHEFTLDTSEEKYDLLYNERIQLDDFEGLDKDEYFKKSYDELEKFADNLPPVGAGFIINLDLPIEDNTIEGEDEND